MKAKYDKETDILYITFSEEKVLESDEIKPGVIVDYSEKGHIVGIEILRASNQMIEPLKFEYEVA